MINIDRICSDLETLAQFGAEGVGVARPGFSNAYRQAVDWLSERMREAGLSVREDAAGNLIGRLGPAGGAAVVSGSHIDSVPNGGKYDGTLGVLAALEVARSLEDRAASLRHAFEVIAFMDEEGAFLGELGCRAMAGTLTFSDLEGVRGRDGSLLVDAMEAYGIDPRGVDSAARPRGDFRAYVELHIEQGPVLESRRFDIGVVTGIVGIHVSEFIFSGEANHAGTTPVPMRKDAMRAAAEAMTAVFRQLESEFLPDRHRVTYGAVDLAPGAQNVVPERVTLTQEIRAETLAQIDELYAMTCRIAGETAARHGVAMETNPVSFDAPAEMSERVMALIEEQARDSGCRVLRMPSGAGHDAQVMAQVADTGMIFIPSIGGISHNPAEHSSRDQIERGATVLSRTIESLLFR